MVIAANGWVWGAIILGVYLGKEQGAEGTEKCGILLKSFVFYSSDFVVNVQRLFSLILSLGTPSHHTTGKGPGQALSCSAAHSLGKSDFCGMNAPSAD